MGRSSRWRGSSGASNRGCLQPDNLGGGLQLPCTTHALKHRQRPALLHTATTITIIRLPSEHQFLKRSTRVTTELIRNVVTTNKARIVAQYEQQSRLKRLQKELCVRIMGQLGCLPRQCEHYTQLRDGTDFSPTTTCSAGAAN